MKLHFAQVVCTALVLWKVSCRWCMF